MSDNQMYARLFFGAGVAFIWLVLGIEAVAGAGLMLLIIVFAREIELRGRQASVEPEHWPPNQSQTLGQD